MIIEKHRNVVEQYICGIVKNLQCKPIAIYCNPDHTHLLVGLHPSISISDLAKNVKSSSSKWINQNKWLKGHFSWQQGYGAFSYSKTSLDSVVRYILNQPDHHKRLSFNDEYQEILKEFEIDYDEKFLFQFEKK